MSVIHEERRNPLDLRMLLVPGAFAGAFGVMVLRLWYLQYAGADAIAEEASKSTTLTVETPAPRGLIVDRRGETLAGVQSQIVVTAIPKIALKDAESMAQVAQLIGVPLESIEKKLKAEQGSYLPVPVAQNITVAQATKLAELLSVLPDQKPGKEKGLAAYAVNSFPMRTYSHAFEFAHILGYVKSADDRDIERIEEKLEAAGDRTRKPGRFVGKSGVERTAELDLMGFPSREEYITDHRRKPLLLQNSSQAIPGNKLILSVDGELQRYAYEQLGSYTGAVVALDPKSGEVLCMVSKPSYDVMPFITGMTTKEYAALSDNDDKPLTNRAIAERYAPGSTFKIVTTIASYLAGKDPFSASFYCDGWIRVGKDPPKKCLGHHGLVTYERAMAKSCNSFFGQLGMRLRRKELEKACEIVGLGSRTGIDLVGEVKGLIPDDAQAERILRVEKRRYSQGDQLNSSIGQGVVTTTPIQMANLAAFVANHGKSYTPHLIHARSEFGNAPKVEVPTVAHQMQAPPEFWSHLISGLEGVVNWGTAIRSRIPGVRFAGKTGSAEVWLPRRGPDGKRMKDSRGREMWYKLEGLTHSWFVAFAPVDNPKIAICVMAERAGHGSDVAAPIASRIVQKYLGILDNKKPATAPDIQVTPTVTTTPASLSRTQNPSRPGFSARRGRRH